MCVSMRSPLRAALIIAAAIGSLLIGPVEAYAGSFGPTLAIGQVVARPVGDTATVEVTGMFGFDDLLQVDFPLNLVIFQGKNFVRYPVGGTPQSGVFMLLRNGVQAREIDHIEELGVDDPAAEILQLQPHKFLVSLPPTIGNGPITVVLYVELELGTYLSNHVSVMLTGVTGGGE